MPEPPYWYAVNCSVSEFDLGRCATSGQAFRWVETPVGWKGIDGVNVYVVDVVRNGDQVEYRIAASAPETAFRQLFRLDWSAEQGREEILARGPELAPYLRDLAGLRLMRPSGLTETLFSFLCTPNNHIRRITQMVEHLASFGEPMDVAGLGVHRLFPTVERLARVEESDLRSRGFGYRAATIPAVARMIELNGGEGYLETLRASSYETVIAALIELPGVGPKLADCIALFALHHTESVPVDTHIWQAMTRLYFPEWQDTSLTARKYAAVSGHLRERFGPWSGWVQQYLFVDNVVNGSARRGAARRARQGR